MYHNKLKAVTFSYDDGVEQDRRLVELFNRYGLKCTFNVNSGMLSAASIWNNEGRDIPNLNGSEIAELFKGHEVASHSLTHPHLENFSSETVLNELNMDIDIIERLTGHRPVGFAYPFGTYNDTVLDAVRKCGLKYGRDALESEGFEPPKGDLTVFSGTCRHANPRLFELAERFIALKPDRPQLFYIWGHSYEFDMDDNWDMMERFCELISRRDDIYYGTNREVFGL